MFEIREELLHVVFAHFPIAMLSLALLCKIILVLTPEKFALTKSKIEFSYLSLLFSAPMFYLITIFLGDTALDLIKNDVCNLTLVYEHEQTAEKAIPFFLVTIVLEVLLLSKKITKAPLLKLLSLISLIFLIIGNLFMFKAAHLGGQMVYEYGTAVKNYKCSE